MLKATAVKCDAFSEAVPNRQALLLRWPRAKVLSRWNTARNVLADGFYSGKTNHICLTSLEPRGPPSQFSALAATLGKFAGMEVNWSGARCKRHVYFARGLIKIKKKPHWHVDKCPTIERWDDFDVSWEDKWVLSSSRSSSRRQARKQPPHINNTSEKEQNDGVRQSVQCTWEAEQFRDCL